MQGWRICSLQQTNVETFYRIYDHFFAAFLYHFKYIPNKYFFRLGTEVWKLEDGSNMIIQPHVSYDHYEDIALFQVPNDFCKSPTWSSWSLWGQCIFTTNLCSKPGTQTRTRLCVEFCDAGTEEIETKYCFMENCEFYFICQFRLSYLLCRYTLFIVQDIRRSRKQYLYSINSFNKHNWLMSSWWIS